jgi:RNA polymerase sigma factor (sigma-70 family)
VCHLRFALAAPPMSDDDRSLLTRWRQGDRAAGSALFQRHFPSIRRFFRNKVSPDDIEDLIQRTFMGCVEGLERFRGDASVRTYLFAVARNQLYKFLRERRNRNAAIDPDLGVSSVVAFGMTPSSVAAARQEHELLLQALQRVSVEQQVLLELFYWEDLPGAEIAAVLEVAPATVRTRLHRARLALQAEIAKLSGPPDLDIEAAAAFLRQI